MPRPEASIFSSGEIPHLEEIRTTDPRARIGFALPTAASGLGTGNSVAKDMPLAEMLVVAPAIPDAAALANRNVKLKSLLLR